MKLQIKTQITDIAGRIFFQHGFATGIDQVTMECAVAKMTIYNQFGSKDGLICAILRESDIALSRKIAVIRAANGLTPKTKLETIFQIILCGMNDPQIKAGLGVKARIEFPLSSHPVHVAGVGLSQSMLQHLDTACKAAGFQSVHARKLLMIAEGCFVTASSMGASASRSIALSMAKELLGGLRYDGELIED